MNDVNDHSILLVNAARKAEAALCVALVAGFDVPDTADSAIRMACEAVPTTLTGIGAKLAMLLEIEAPNLSAETIMVIRSTLASPVLAVPA